MEKLKSSLVSKVASGIASSALTISALASGGMNLMAQQNDHGMNIGGRYFVDYSFKLGYQYLDFDQIFKYAHQTHPNDASFLSGSPGATSVNNSSGLEFGLELSRRVGFAEPYLGVSGLYLFAKENRHKNDNDTRPDANAAFVYSKISPFAAQGDLGMRFYPLKNSGLNLGVGVKGTFLSVEYGWDRFGNNETAKKEDKFLFNAGGTIGYKFNKNVSVEAGYYKGMDNNSSSFLLSFSFNF